MIKASTNGTRHLYNVKLSSFTPALLFLIPAFMKDDARKEFGACRYEKGAKKQLLTVHATIQPGKRPMSNITETFSTIHVALNV